jgi:6-phosphogluconolactonase
MTTLNRTIIYVSCSKGDCIEVLTLDRADGQLSAIETVALPGNGMPLAIAPDKRHLYAALASLGTTAGPQFATFQIDTKTGKLGHQAFTSAPGRMSHIIVDRSGRHLLGASVANDLISSNPIAQDGNIDAQPSEIRTVPSKAHQITTDRTNQFAFVPNLGADLVMQLSFDAATGTFNDNAPPEISQPKGAAPRHMAHHPSGRFAYLLNEEDGSIAAFMLNPETGTLNQIQTSDFLPENSDGKPSGAQILTTPDGRFLYASDRKSSTITLHSIDPATGLLSKRASWPTEDCPRNFAIDPAGNHLIAAGEKSNRVACYAINQSNGDLDLKSTISTGTGPLWIEII